MIEVSVRRMNSAELDRVVEIHLEAFPGFFLTYLGRRFLVRFYESILADPTGIALIAVVPGQGVVGFAMGTTEPHGFYSRLFRRRLLPIGLSILPSILRRPSTLIRVIRRVLQRATGPTAALPGTELMSLAVRPAARGVHAGKRLVETFMDEARRAGSESLWLLADAVDNEAVLEFYKRLGFANIRQMTTPEGRRMVEYRRNL